MQGNLDQPPIVIRSSARKSLALMTACGLAAALSWLDLSLAPSSPRAASGLVAFGLCVPYYAWLFLCPNVLTLSPEGMTLQTRWRKAQWSWDQVSNFRSLRVRIASRYVAFDRAEPPSGAAFFMRYYVRYAGADDCLGGGWEMDPGPLADLLNAARERWKTTAGSRLPAGVD